MPTCTFHDSRGDTYYSGDYYVRVTLAESYDVASNTTKVTVSNVEFRSPYNFGGTYSYGKVLVNGTVCADFEHSYVGSQPVNDYVSLGAGSGSVTVSHSATGEASVTVTLAKSDNWSWENEFGLLYNNDLQGLRIANISAQTVALTTRPRASSVSVADGYFGSAVAITITRNSSSFTHTVTVSCAGVSETIATKSSTYPTINWTPAVATYAPKITNAMSATATVTVQTYSGDSLVGTATAACTLTFKAADVAPGVTIAHTDPQGYLSTYGRYVVTKSKIKVTLTPALKYGATVATVSITANGSTYNTNPATTDVISSASNTGISATITDSRGQTATAAAAIAIYDYTAPRINAFSAHRCTAAGADDNTGAYMQVSYDVAITALGNKNSKTLTIKYKKTTDSTYTSRSVAMSAYTASGSVIIAADVNSSYNVQMELTDAFSTTTIVDILPTAYTLMNYGAGVNGGIGIGKVSEKDKVLELGSGWRLEIEGVDVLARLNALQAAIDALSGN